MMPTKTIPWLIRSSLLLAVIRYLPLAMSMHGQR